MEPLIISIVLTLVYLLSWVQYQKNQFLERDYNLVVKNKELSRNWHIWKEVNQVCFFFVLLLFSNWQTSLLCVSIYWPSFDGLFNKLVLKKGFNYIGKTASTDKLLQWFSSITHISVENVSLIFKLSLMIISIFFYSNIFIYKNI